MVFGLGAGIVLSSPNGDRLRYALQIHFAASNNVPENEVAVTLAKLGSSQQAIPTGVSLEHLRKPSIKPSPDSESIFVPADPAAPHLIPAPVAAEPGPGAADPGPGTAEPGAGAAT